MDRTGCERSGLQRFSCKNVLLRRNVSFNGLIVLCHLEVLTSTEKSKKLTMLFHCHETYITTVKVTESSCTCIMSPAEASVYVSC